MFVVEYDIYFCERTEVMKKKSFLSCKRLFSLIMVLSMVLGLFKISAAEAQTDLSENTADLLTAENGKSVSGQLDYSEYKSTVSLNNTSVTPISVFSDDNGTELLKGNKYDFEFSVESAGAYSFEMIYKALDGELGEISLNALLDGKDVFEEFSNLSLSRRFKDSKKSRKDNLGNELAKETEQVYETVDFKLTNNDNTETALIYLDAGLHILNFNNLSNNLNLYKIIFGKYEAPLTYKNYLKELSGEKEYSKVKKYEAENTYLKSSYDLIQLSDNSSVKVTPNSASVDKMNYIGGSNWDQPGEEIIWEINAPESGLYKIGINYRQNSSVNTTFYRTLKIDGKIPFEEAAYLEFPYALNWDYITLGDGNSDYYFYLTEGKHTLSFSVTLGRLTEGCKILEESIYDIAKLYREMVMITGDSPDVNRDYNLFSRIENMNSDLTKNIENLKSVANIFSDIFESESASQIATINSMIDVMKKMQDHKFTAHRNIKRYYDCYSSLSSMLQELKSMPLDFDSIFVGNVKAPKTGFFKSAAFSFKRFILSFSNEHSASQKSEDRTTLTLWVNWGRDQAKVLKYLIQSDFSVKNDIDVDIKITNASLTHAALSGNGPDCQLYLSRSEPVNLAMRGFVYDLTKFKDFEDVKTRFMPSSFDCYKFKDGIYALPDTETFFAMFIRKDIFAELGLSVPKTWDEFTETLVLLLRQNMQVGLPYTQITDMTQVNLGVGALSIYPTLLMQSGGKLYNEDSSKTELLSDLSVDAFVKWTDFYNKYGLLKTYDFFNRFRLGTMPMAIQNYTLYATLTAAAPEISEYWEMYEVPGTLREDNTINNCVAGGGTGAVILSNSEHKNEAWEFIKWWTDTETQYKYGIQIESILGASARVATSNVEALKKYSWRASTLDNLLSQWSKVVQIQEVPGGYYVSRVLDQAFWNVTNASENPKDMLLKWNDVAQTEITRKRKQYNIGE